MQPITTTDELWRLCDLLKESEFITVDTEFLRENSYYSKLCLIQVANNEGAYAIDPLADGIDLRPFLDLLENHNVLKVLHACRQDIEIFYQLMGKLPTPIFDTQIAAMVCGFGDSAGYETLVTKITNSSLDKSARYTDWSQRPLSDTQLKYAIGDVTHLRDVYRSLMQELEATDRTSWVSEEMAGILDERLYFVEPDEAWQRLKVRTNKPRFLGILRSIAAWRESQAIERDLPRGRVAKDEVLLEIAAHPPQKPDYLDKVRGLPKGFGRSRAGRSLMEAITQGLEAPESSLPQIERAKPRPATPPMADLLKVLLKIRCQQHKVAPRLIANTQELEAWAAEPSKADFRCMTGWRYDIFGKDALKLMQGNLALTASNGGIDVVELEDDETTE